MNIHEYQAKAALAKFGVPVPRGFPAMSVEEAKKAARELGGPVWVVKAQIHAGGRGKGGGVKVVKSIDDVEKEATRCSAPISSHRRPAQGQEINRLLSRTALRSRRSLSLDAGRSGVLARRDRASTEGGMESRRSRTIRGQDRHLTVDPVATSARTTCGAFQGARLEPISPSR